MLGSVALLVLWMGVWPRPFIDVMHASVEQLLAHVARSKL
jgi:NADH-quinone oxidoreductase subunit M